MIQEFLKDESGQGMVEYGLILALIAIVVIVAVGLIGTNLNTLFNSTATTLGSTANGGGATS
jgi:pilus assembly protein Flp/PilA